MLRSLTLRARRRLAGGAVLVAISAVVLLAAAPAAGALLRPLEGAGNFHSVVDVVNRHEEDGSVSVVLLISVANREVTFAKKKGRLTGRLQVEATLEGDDGSVVSKQTKVDLRTQNAEQAASPTVYQILPLVLPGVRATSGRLTIELLDTQRERPGLLSMVKQRRWARSQIAADWSAPAAAREPEALAVGDPVFLAKAPIALWAGGARAGGEAPERSRLTDHLHPNRRYGLEQERLQVYFEVEPPLQGGGAAAARDGLFVQVLAKDLEFAVRDTLRLDPPQLAALNAGGTTGIYYEMSVKDLPPGAYQLSVAPGNREGRPWLAEFDVVWSLDSLRRFGDELLGEGRTILAGDELKAFELAGAAEREDILERFWQDRDPDPDTALNEAFLDFRRRVSYVREFLGGFNASGAVDPRGRIFLWLGPPDEISKTVLPLNQTDQREAVIQVYDNYAPEREGTSIKGRSGIPIETTRQSRRELATGHSRIWREKGFELWNYNHAGRQLFPNPYSGQNLGLRFLFVDRTGNGDWVLDSTNAMDIGG